MGIVQKLLAGLFLVLAFWAALLAFGAVGVVEHIGGLAAGESEAGIRKQTAAMFSSLVEEKARRHDEVFRQAADRADILSGMARSYLLRKKIYGRENVFRSDRMERCPANGLYSNSADELTNIVYCCRDRLPAAFSAYNNVYLHLDPLLERIQQSNPAYLAVWTAYEFAWHSGFVHYYPNIHYIESIPPPEVSTSWDSAYYQVVRPENNPLRETRWTKALNDDTGVGLIVSVISPITIQGLAPLCGAALDISLKTLVDEILSFEFRPGRDAKRSPDGTDQPGNAFAFLLERDGSIIAFPEMRLAAFGLESIEKASLSSGQPLDMNLRDSSLGSVAGFAAAVAAQPEGTASVLAGTEAYSLFFHRIEATGWTYCIAIPETELFTPVEKTRGAIASTVAGLARGLSWGSAAFLAGSLLLALLYLRRRMLSPLRALAEAMRRAANGDLAQRVDAGPAEDEMAALARSFNAMTSGLEARQAALGRAEAKYRDIFENSAEGMFQCAPDGRLVTVNPAFAAILGCASPEEAQAGLGDFLAACCTVPGDRDRFHARLAQEGLVAGFDTQFRRADGTVIWGSVSARAVRGPDGAVEVLDGSLLDITERRRAEDHAADLNQNLLEAQEEKRSDMARDLHDELAQNLSSLKIDSDRLARSSPDGHEARALLREFSRNLNRSLDSICDLVYDLFPADLDEKGLAEALRRHVHDFATEHGIRADFRPAPDLALAELPGLTRIMIFRIAQEALRNVQRHARATAVRVELGARESRVVLRVADNGQGFDPAEAARAALAERRMGLAGMRERASILGAEFQVNAAPGQGAEILVSAPAPDPGPDALPATPGAGPW